MHVTRTSKRAGAFTLVEILIVVVILGILAAIVVPQFTNAANEARTGNIVTQTSTIETQLELFAARNNGQYPDLATDGWGDAATAGTMIGDDYLKDAPINPITGTSTIAALTATTPSAADAEADAATPGSGDSGWLYNQTVGLIRANGGDYDNDGS